jgi:hypothetical protein
MGISSEARIDSIEGKSTQTDCAFQVTENGVISVRVISDADEGILIRRKGPTDPA